MVKGISRQVILVRPPDRKLFEQAIFILKDDAVGREGITDEMLLQEARQALRKTGARPAGAAACGPVWACGGALVTGLIWLATVVF